MPSTDVPVLQPSVDLLKILYLYSEGTETWMVYFDNHTQQCVAVSDSLNHWENHFPSFWRINDSYLINPALIYRFHPAEMPHFPLPLVELITGRTLAVSRQRTKLILKKWQRAQCAFSA